MAAYLVLGEDEKVVPIRKIADPPFRLSFKVLLLPIPIQRRHETSIPDLCHAHVLLSPTTDRHERR